MEQQGDKDHGPFCKFADVDCAEFVDKGLDDAGVLLVADDVGRCFFGE